MAPTRRKYVVMTKSVQRGKKTAAKKTTGRKSAGKRGRVSRGPSMTREKQTALFDKAVALFNAGQLRKAMDAFDSVTGGESAEVAHAARMYRAVCERRLAAGEVKLATPEEHYDYAIALINQRELGAAQDHLNKALRGLPDGDHVHYALAICHGLQGEMAEAAEHLSTAIELEPRNRAAARHDADFVHFASAPEIAAILDRRKAQSD